MKNYISHVHIRMTATFKISFTQYTLIRPCRHRLARLTHLSGIDVLQLHFAARFSFRILTYWRTVN